MLSRKNLETHPSYKTLKIILYLYHIAINTINLETHLSMKEQKKKNGNSSLDIFGIASTMGMHMISAPAVGAGLGYLIDRFIFNSWPYASAVGLILGIIAGFRIIFTDAKRLQNIQDRVDKYENPPK